MALPSYIPTNSVKSFLFFASLPTFVISCLFDNRYPSRYEVISPCGFDLHFPDVEHPFMYL